MTLTNQSLSYGETVVLRDITLHFQEGEKVALLGKSGSGKSTLLRHLFALKQEHCAYIPQELGLVQSLSVFHNVYISQLHKHSFFYNAKNLFFPIAKEITAVQKVLQCLEMDAHTHQACGELSGGQMQRVAIARALMEGKEILLADEPISALDEQLTKIVIEQLFGAFETIVCAIHNVSIALQYFDRAIGIKNGEIFLDKPTNSLLPEEIEQLYDACSL